MDAGKVYWLPVTAARRNYLASVRRSLYVPNYDIGRTSPLNQPGFVSDVALPQQSPLTSARGNKMLTIRKMIIMRVQQQNRPMHAPRPPY